MDSKPFYQSKTVGFNVMAIIALIASQFGYTGEVTLDAEATAGVMAVVNLVLRFFTNKGVSST